MPSPYSAGIQIRIREAKISDTATVAEFNLLMAWETETRRLEPERVQAGVAALLSDPAKGTYFLAEIENNGVVTVAGQLLITYEWSDWRNGNFWWIQSVYVVSELRSKGVFRALFAHINALANGRKEVCGLRLYMDAHNNQARRTYDRLGLKQTNYQVFEVDFVMDTQRHPGGC